MEQQEEAFENGLKSRLMVHFHCSKHSFNMVVNDFPASILDPQVI